MTPEQLTAFGAIGAVVVAGVGAFGTQWVAGTKRKDDAPRAISVAAQMIAETAHGLIGDLTEQIEHDRLRLDRLIADLRVVRAELAAESARCKGIEKDLRALRALVERDNQ